MRLRAKTRIPDKNADAITKSQRVEATPCLPLLTFHALIPDEPLPATRCRLPVPALPDI
jgi:hypothetical protein